MCCKNNPGSVRYLKRKMEKAGGWMTFWKVRASGGGGGLYALYGTGGWRTPGTKRANAVKRTGRMLERVLGGPLLDPENVHAGIHVYRRRQDAQYTAELYKYRVVIPVRCHVGDLIASSSVQHWQDLTAVFCKVTLWKRDYERAVRKLRRRVSR